MTMDKKIFVHIELTGITHPVGTLWISEKKGEESSTFEYFPEWYSSKAAFSLEPALHLGEGKYHKEKRLFGSIGDSAPDRWGSFLMLRQESRLAKLENRQARTLKMSDFLLMVNDFTRQGALRFSENLENPSFLTTYSKEHIPPLIKLRSLLEASNRIIEGKALPEDIKDLFEPGSSLGGARPKAVVLNPDNALLIAKFPSPEDKWDVETWEYLSLRMANRAGINTPKFWIHKVLDKNVLLLKKFDRDKNQYRIPFLSAMSLLDASDGKQEEKTSYLDIADALMEHGSKTSQDLRELWRRIVLNVLISNVDDHLRNHAFLYDGSDGWRLSPIYDLEPTPVEIKSRFLRTSINEADHTASLELAYEVAELFEFKPTEARKEAKKIADVIKYWNKDAAELGICRQEIELMSSAFEHHDLKLALKNPTISPGSGTASKNDES